MDAVVSPSFGALRDEIFVQHGRLRALLEGLRSAAERVVRSDKPAPADLAGMLDTLVHALEGHMTFEERGLTEAPGAARAWGATNVAHLREEHARQRDELARITREARSSDDRISLALAIQAFVSDVLLDMSLEEARLAQ